MTYGNETNFLIQHIMKKLFALALILAASLLAFSCKPSSLNGKWNITAVNGETVKTVEKTPFLEFNEAEGRIHGCFGVNTVNGSYTFGEDGKLSIDNLMMTMMAGVPQDMEIENKVREAANTVVAAKVKGGKLSLLDADGKEVLTLVKEK